MAQSLTRVGGALLLALTACNVGPPSEDTLRARAQRECQGDKQLPPGSAALRYCIDDEMKK